jgi:hypothetical protein
MLIAIWLLGLTLLALWSALFWALHAGWQQLAALPVGDAIAALESLELPGIPDGWLQEVELLRVALLAAMKWLQPWMQGGSDVLGAAVPLALGVTWGLGCALLLGLTIAGALGVAWWRRHETARATRAAA